MNRDRRKIVGSIFANAATYTLTGGAITGILSGKFDLSIYVLIGIMFAIFVLVAYFVTPKDKEDKS